MLVVFTGCSHQKLLNRSQVDKEYLENVNAISLEGDGKGLIAFLDEKYPFSYQMQSVGNLWKFRLAIPLHGEELLAIQFDGQNKRLRPSGSFYNKVKSQFRDRENQFKAFKKVLTTVAYWIMMQKNMATSSCRVVEKEDWPYQCFTSWGEKNRNRMRVKWKKVGKNFFVKRHISHQYEIEGKFRHLEHHSYRSGHISIIDKQKLGPEKNILELKFYATKGQ